MEQFGKFFKKHFAFEESIDYIDRTLFSRIINEEFKPTDEELAKLDIELSDADNAKSYLDNEAELELIQIYKDNPDSEEGLEARNKIIENKLNWIYLLAHKSANLHRIKDNQFNDAVQNAVIALVHAIDLFDPDKGVPFTAYAKQWILAGITNPYNPVRQKSISSDLVGKDSQFSLTSIDAPVGNDTSDDKVMSIADTIASRSAGTNPFDELDEKDISEKLNLYLNKLTDIERKAIEMRFTQRPDGSVATFEEIGKELGKTKMGAKLIVDRALNSLKQFAREELPTKK